MSIQDKFFDWESMPISSIKYLMIKWFDFDSVESDFHVRDNVESGVWISLKIHKGEKNWYVDGQRLDIVKRRLIELLDSLNVRNGYLLAREKQY